MRYTIINEREVMKMLKQLERFVITEFNYCCRAPLIEDKIIYFHNAYGAVAWESYRSGRDLEVWWLPWREKFLKEIWGE